MARDSSGSQNQPQYSGTGASADAADLSELGNYAALVGNRKTGPTSLRNTVSGTDVWDGLLWGDTTDGFEYKRVSGGWVAVFKPGSQPFAMAAGTVSAVIVAGGSTSDATITFPTGRFTVAPILTATNNQFGNPDAYGFVTVMSVSATGATIRRAIASSTSQVVGISWNAVQMTPTTSAG